MTFVEIIKEAADMQQRNAIFSAIMEKGHVPYATVYAWINGQRVPKYLYQVLIHDIVNEITGRYESIEEMFPEPSAN